MPKTQSLDEFIAAKAAEFADHVRHAAELADTEEEIRIDVETQLAFIKKEAGIDFEQVQGRHEFTVAKGRIDSLYARVVIEYKNPSDPQACIGPKLDSPGTKKVVEQIKSRFRALKDEQGHPIQSLFGVGLDGRRSFSSASAIPSGTFKSRSRSPNIRPSDFSGLSTTSVKKGSHSARNIWRAISARWKAPSPLKA